MHKAWNAEKGFFGQSYEDLDVVDSSLMIMPLVFFSTPVSIFSCFTCTYASASGVGAFITVGSTVLGYPQADPEDARKRRINVQREILTYFHLECLPSNSWHYISCISRVSFTATTLASPTTALEEKKGHSACVPFGMSRSRFDSIPLPLLHS